MNDNMRFHGFISQSFLISQGNDFLVPNSQEGSHELNELGFTAQSNLTPKLRVGFQLLSRDFGDIDNNQTKVDWAFADYRWRDFLGVRFGKAKMPFGLYNESRDTDILRPMALLPQSIYDEHYRSYFVSYQGTGLYGSIFAGGLGTFDYNLYTGSINFNEDQVIMNVTNDLSNQLMENYFYNASQLALKQTTMQDTIYPDSLFSSSHSFEPYEYTNARMQDIDALMGGTLFWNINADPIPLMDNLKVGYSYVKVDLDFLGGERQGSYTVYDPAGNPIPQASDEMTITKRDGGVPTRFAYSLEYTFRRLTLAAEYAQHELDLNFYDENDEEIAGFDRKDNYYYLLASFLLKDKFTISVLYDYIDLNEMTFTTSQGETDLKEALGYEDWQSERTDIGFGLRYDINFNWTLKAEYHMMNGTAKVYSSILNPQDDDPEEDWSYGLIKASYNF